MMKHKTPKMAEEGGVTEMEDYIRSYAQKYFEDMEQSDLEKRYGKLPWKKLSVDIDWSRLLIKHDRVRYDAAERSKLVPTDSTLFKSSYNNTTSGKLHYQVTTERRTRTRIATTIIRGFRLGGKFDMKFSPPTLEANIGLSSEINFDKNVQTTKEEDVSWTLNTNIDVPPHTSTTVELVVKNHEYDGKFTIRSFFSGEIHVDIRKDNTHLTTIIISDELRDLLTEDLGFKYDAKTKRIYFDTIGDCYCQYGVEQEVKTSESPLPSEEG